HFPAPFEYECRCAEYEYDPKFLARPLTPPNAPTKPALQAPRNRLRRIVLVLGLIGPGYLKAALQASQASSLIPQASFLIPHSLFLIPHSSFLIRARAPQTFKYSPAPSTTSTAAPSTTKS
ncbi:MAG: hypothetical protein RL215_1858, partial [Planctomycetota bacterium]